MASADHAEPAFGDVRRGVLRDALHHGAGAGIFADRAGAVQPAEAAESSSGHPDPAGNLRRDSFDAASILVRHAVFDRSREAVSVVVHAVATGVLLPVSDCGGTGDDDFRIVAEFQTFRTAARIA